MEQHPSNGNRVRANSNDEVNEVEHLGGSGGSRLVEESSGQAASSTDESDDNGEEVNAVSVHDTGGERRAENYSAEGVARRPSGGENEDDEDDDDDDSKSAGRDSTILNAKWEDSFQRLVAFKKVHGHCLVPNRYREDPQLGSWGTLYYYLSRFIYEVADYGTSMHMISHACYLPYCLSRYYPWHRFDSISTVSTQRRQYKLLMSGSGTPTSMTLDRARRLEELGFQWSTTDPRHVPWEQRYDELREFVVSYKLVCDWHFKGMPLLGVHEILIVSRSSFNYHRIDLVTLRSLLVGR